MLARALLKSAPEFQYQSVFPPFINLSPLLISHSSLRKFLDILSRKPLISILVLVAVHPSPINPGRSYHPALSHIHVAYSEIISSPLSPIVAPLLSKVWSALAPLNAIRLYDLTISSLHCSVAISFLVHVFYTLVRIFHDDVLLLRGCNDFFEPWTSFLFIRK